MFTDVMAETAVILLDKFIKYPTIVDAQYAAMFPIISKIGDWFKELVHWFPPSYPPSPVSKEFLPKAK